MSNSVEVLNTSADTSATPSYAIWGGMYDNDRHEYVEFFDDFHGKVAEGGVYNYDESDDNAALTISTTAPNGELGLVIASDDNEELTMNTVAPLCKIDGNTGKVFFEARIKTSAITDDNALFCGLGLIISAGNAIYQDDDTAALAAAVSFVGFRSLCADGDGLDAVYKTASGSEGVVLELAHTLVADTYVKVGLTFDGKVGGTITYFVNGVAVGTVTEDTSGFPDNVNLAFVMGNKVGANAALTTTIDWVKVAHERI